MRSDIKPGATFPDYELPDHEGDLPERIVHGWSRWSRERVAAERGHIGLRGT